MNTIIETTFTGIGSTCFEIKADPRNNLPDDVQRFLSKNGFFLRVSEYFPGIEYHVFKYNKEKYSIEIIVNIKPSVSVYIELRQINFDIEEAEFIKKMLHFLKQLF